MRLFFLTSLIFFSFCSGVFAQESLHQSEQMVLVTTPNWEATSGMLQRYERATVTQPWKKVGGEIPVVVGKKGMAWGSDTQPELDAGPVKQEGDNKTPAGIYLIGPGFGFDQKSLGKLDYFPLTDTSVCVDDTSSKYYNQVLDSAKVPTIDWHSGEQMRQVELYKIGSVVQYNMQHPKPGAGSCIFLHIWRSPTAGTAGCIAMDETRLADVLQWLNSRKKPMMVLITTAAYPKVKTTWHLPSL